MTLGSLPIFDPTSQNDLSRSRATQSVESKPLHLTDLSQRSAWLREMERSQAATWFKPFEDSAANQTAAAPWPASTAPFVPALSGLAVSERPETNVTAENPQHGALDASAPHESTNHPNEESAATQALAKHLSGALQTQVAPLLGRPLAATTASVASNTANTSIAGIQLTLAQQASLQVTTTVEILIAPSAELITTSVESTHADQADTAEGIEGSAQASSPRASDSPSIRLHAQWGKDEVSLWLGMDGTAAQISSQAAVIVPELHRYFNAQGIRLGKVVCNGQVVFDLADTPSLNPATSFSQFLQPIGATELPDKATPRPPALPSPTNLPTPYFLPSAYPQEIS